MYFKYTQNVDLLFSICELNESPHLSYSVFSVLKIPKNAGTYCILWNKHHINSKKVMDHWIVEEPVVQTCMLVTGTLKLIRSSQPITLLCRGTENWPSQLVSQCWRSFMFKISPWQQCCMATTKNTTFQTWKKSQ